MNGLRVRELADELLGSMIEAGYAASTVAGAHRALDVICEMHREADAEDYDQGVVSDFVEGVSRMERDGEISQGQRRLYARTARRLAELSEGAMSFSLRGTRETGLCPCFEAAVSSLADSRDWSDEMAEAVRRAAVPYLRWIQGRGINDIAKVDDRIVREYFVEISGRMEPGSVDAIRRRLKKFHGHLAAEGLAESLDDAFGFSVRIRRKIIKPASHDELASVLALIDRDDPKGKRDYAVIILAAVLGLRGVDIVGLVRRDIDWPNGEIAVRQSKTGRVVALPLTADVGTALRDYLLTGRPDRDDDHVFLSCRAPFAPLSSTVPYQILNGYRRKAGLPPAQLHGLRRAVGTNLVIGGTPVSAVAQILGHSDVDSTRQYISLDTRRLKEVALGLEGIPPMKWGDSR